MSETFDPYYKWLGIPPTEQPPNHYRLLGLREFEDDPEVIQASADRQMGHIRGFQTGRYSAHSQKLLNELATARLTLVKPERKAAYDEELRAQRAPIDSPEVADADAFDFATLQPAPSKPTAAAPVRASRPVAINRSPSTAPATKAQAPQPLWKQPRFVLAVGGSIAAVLLLAIIGMALTGPGDVAPKPPAPIALAPSPAEPPEQAPPTPIKPPVTVVPKPVVPAPAEVRVEPVPIPAPKPAVEDVAAPTTPPTSPIPPPTVPTTVAPTEAPATVPDASPATTPPQPAVAPPAVASQPMGPVNLLKFIDLDNGWKNGDLRWEGDVLVGVPWNDYRTQINYHPTTSTYRIDMLAECVVHKGPVNVGVCVGGRQFLVGVDFDGSTFVSEKPGEGNYYDPQWRIPIFEVGKTSKVQISVNPKTVSLLADGKLIIDNYDHRQLKRLDSWNGPDKRALSIGWNFGGFKIHSIILTPLGKPDPDAVIALVGPATPPVGPADNVVPPPAAPNVPAAVAKKSPPPTAEINREVKRLRDSRSDEYTKANSEANKTQLALSIFQMGHSAQSTPIYARLTEVIRLATEAGDWQLAEMALTALNDLWTVDVWSLRMEILQDTGKHVNGAAANKSFYQRLVQATQEMERDDRTDLTTRIAPLIVRVAAETQDPELRKQASQLSADLRKYATARQAVDRAIETLKTQPDDAPANLLYGKYLCTRGNWVEGLPLLAKGGERSLNDLAQRDSASPSLADEQLSLADAFWDAAETNRSGLKDLLRQRGAYWYSSALPNLTNLTKLKAQKRLDEFRAGR